MKKMYKSRNEENLLPFHIIKAASEGDVSAINTVLKHYEGYIIKLSTRKLYDESGQVQQENCGLSLADKMRVKFKEDLSNAEEAKDNK